MSMLLCVVTPLAVFMAADSRQYPSGADTVQKVFLVGKDAIVSHGGIGVIPHDGGSWDAAEELKRIAAATASGTFQEQFNFIRQQVMSSISVALRHYTARFSNNPHFTIMLAKRNSAGRTYFARQEFKLISTESSPDKWIHRVEANPVQTLVDGETARSGVWWDVPPECRVTPPPKIDLSPKAAFDSISGIIRVVAGQSAYCTQMIGGPIRAAISDAGGARWF